MAPEREENRAEMGIRLMKRLKMTIFVIVFLCALSSCGRAEDLENIQMDAEGSGAEISEENIQEVSDEAEEASCEGESDAYYADAELEHLMGEYEYLSDSGTGKLAIEKTSYGYDISDYESESSYRFLADSSNIETIEDNRIYMKYPEQVSSDGRAVFGYYILEYGADEIKVYYGKSSFDEAEFLYLAAKKIEAAGDVYEYEGEYNSYDVNEPALEIKKNDDGTYRIQIDLFRLYMLRDGIGEETEKGLEFAATGPGGNVVNGVIKLEEDIAAVTIFGQEWLDFAGLSEYEFYKTSDVPNIREIENTSPEATADELLDSFINGRISAADSADLTSTFYITDFNMESEEWDAYSVGEKIDLDNDGENELIINGPYGGIYLDARDNRVYKFAASEGTALTLSYTYYNGAVWILYSNRSSAGFEFYHMEKYEGADNFVAEMNFGEEFVEFYNAEAGIKYTLNGAEISYEEYAALCSKIFAAEVSTG